MEVSNVNVEFGEVCDNREVEEGAAPYLLSQQRPGLQRSLRLVLLFDGQQGLEELGRLR